ncbi:hypothetical protein [Hydrogenophaga sp. T2]|uniref:hypothetical protein n=1 Tax=Hydrogenophaga sp. T2 TaxID=3132823 RepID=UPI003CF5E82A
MSEVLEREHMSKAVLAVNALLFTLHILEPEASPPCSPTMPDAPAEGDTLTSGNSLGIHVIDGSNAQDILIDDASGVVRYRNRVLSGGRRTRPGADEWQGEDATYYRLIEGDRQHLIICAGESAVLIQDWTDGAFGIVLLDAEPPAWSTTATSY